MGVFPSAMLSSWHPSVPQQPEPKKEKIYIKEYLYIQYKCIQYIYILLYIRQCIDTGIQQRPLKRPSNKEALNNPFVNLI